MPIVDDECCSAAALLKVAGRQNNSDSQQQTPRTQKIVVQVKEVESELLKSGQLWYTLSSTSAGGKIKSGRSTGAFSSSHEIVMRRDQSLVFKLKKNGLLHGSSTVGSCISTIRNMDEFVPLLDSSGLYVGKVHMTITCAEAILPSLQLVACPWSKHENTIVRDFEMAGSSDRVNVLYNVGMHVFAVIHGPSRVTAGRHQSGETHKWILKAPARRMTLTCATKDCSEFKLDSQEYSLAKGNLFEECDVEGTWTLCKSGRAVAIINVAGPFISCRSKTDVAVATALGNAMYISTALNQRVWEAVVTRALSRRAMPQSFLRDGIEACSAVGFLVSGGPSFLSLSLKQVGIGSHGWLNEHTYLRRNIAKECKSCDEASVLSSELGWSGALGLMA